jgi:thiol-disulfide isomerase/thioredoxin
MKHGIMRNNILIYRRITLFLILLTMLVLMAGCGSRQDQSDNPSGSKTNESEQHPDDTALQGLTSFQTTDINGEKKNQDIFADYKLTMINVWGTFCDPCIGEMPVLGELQKEYESKGVNIVGIVVDAQDKDLQPVDDQLQLARDIAKKTGAGYTHLLMSKEIMDNVLSQFDSIPVSFFVDSDGNIVSEFYVGARTKEKWVNIIEEQMEKQK